MKVTETGGKHSQPKNRGLPLKDSAEHEGYAGACDSERITENNITNASGLLAKILPFVEGKLFLKVNTAKTTVDYVVKVKFLGMSFYQSKGKTRIRIHPKSVAKMKHKIRELTSRS